MAKIKLGDINLDNQELFMKWLKLWDCHMIMLEHFSTFGNQIYKVKKQSTS